MVFNRGFTANMLSHLAEFESSLIWLQSNVPMYPKTKSLHNSNEEVNGGYTRSEESSGHRSSWGQMVCCPPEVIHHL